MITDTIDAPQSADAAAPSHTPLQDFTYECVQLMALLRQQYAEAHSTLGIFQRAQKEAFTQKLEPVLAQAERNIVDLQKQIEQFVQPTYNVTEQDSADRTSLQADVRDLQRKIAALEEEDQRISIALNQELAQLARDLGAQLAKRTSTYTEIDAQLGAAIDEKSRSLDSTQKAIVAAEEGCCGCFSCLSPSYKQLKAKKAITERELKNLETQKQTINQHEKIVAIDEEISVINAAIEQKKQELLGRPMAKLQAKRPLDEELFKLNSLLQELEAMIQKRTEQISFAIDNPRMFFCLRAYETLRALYDVTDEIVDVCRPAKHTEQTEKTAYSVLTEIIKTLREALQRLYDKFITRLFSLHSGDCEGDFFHERFEKLTPPEKRQILAPAPTQEIQDRCIPPINGQLLFENEGEIVGISPLPEVVSSPPSARNSLPRVA